MPPQMRENQTNIDYQHMALAAESGNKSILVKQESKRKSKRSSVKFSEEDNLTFSYLDNLTDDEINKIWYSKAHFTKFIEDARYVAKNAKSESTSQLLKATQLCQKSYQNGKEKKKTVTLLNEWCQNGNGQCCRGLESMGNSKVSKFLKENQKNVVSNVVTEQRMWRIKGRKCDDTYFEELKALSESGSRFSKEFAVAIAEADAQVSSGANELVVIKKTRKSFSMKRFFKHSTK